ncbi:hypothetical protein MKW94_005028, partial [Papaver nudicaule]|nr:hypothetical protein [Papaver nudicaule]
MLKPLYLNFSLSYLYSFCYFFILQGYGVNAFYHDIEYPLLYGGNGLTGCTKEAAQFCTTGCLDRELVKGKIVICDAAAGLDEAFESGASGVILIDEKFSDGDYVVYPLSATLISIEIGEVVKSYLKSTKDPVATIRKSESSIDYKAPVVASFSSRGPNNIFHDIIKA